MTMRVITKSILIASVARRYKRQYDGKGRALFGLELTHGEHYELLRHATTEDEIERIIGNRDWTRNECGECRRDCEITIALFYDEPSRDFDGLIARICLECLEKAVALAKSA